MGEYKHFQEDCIEIYKGNKIKSNSNCSKVIVFDLDETLGNFLDLEILWITIKKNIENSNQITFNSLIDLYPEFLRTKIIKILEYIYKKKKTRECFKLYLYTNNQSKNDIVNYIINYFTNKITNGKDNLFDQIIYAFKINEQIIQIGRTGHQKSHKDFINCTLLSPGTSICFIDDNEFNEMKKDKIYYIQPRPYKHNLSSYEIIDRLLNSDKFGPLFKDNKKHIHDQFIIKSIHSKNLHKINNRTKKFLTNEEKISKRIMYHIKEFFLFIKKKLKTKKKNKNLHNFTRKKCN